MTPDEIIEFIDAGLQTPLPDPTYGEVSPRSVDTCVRCTRKRSGDSDFCEPCRAFLLGDASDPLARPPLPLAGGLDWCERLDTGQPGRRRRRPLRTGDPFIDAVALALSLWWQPLTHPDVPSVQSSRPARGET